MSGNNAAKNSSEDGMDRTYNIPDRRAILTDRQLVELSYILSTNWEIAMINLGLTSGDIFRCKADNKFSVQRQIFNALRIWRNQYPDNACLEDFVTEVRKCDGVEVDWKQLKEM